jgi:hypothetical protein
MIPGQTVECVKRASRLKSEDFRLKKALSDRSFWTIAAIKPMRLILSL